MVFPGFVGPGYQSQAKVIDGERSINWYPEVIESGQGKGGAKFVLQPTPGKKLFATLPPLSQPAQTFFDNTSVLPPIGNNTRPFPGFLAASFSAPAGNDWVLAAVSLILVNNGIVNLTAKVNVDLYASISVGGFPAMGALIANLGTNITQVITVGAPVALVNITPLAATPTLSAGKRYWIVVTDPTNSGFGWKFTSPWSSAGTGVVTEFNNGSGGVTPPDATPADFFSNNQASTDPNGTSPPYYMKVTGSPLVFAPGRGIAAGGDPVAGQRCFAAAGATLYEVKGDGTSTVIGAIQNATTPVQMFQNGAQLFVVSGNVAYIDNGAALVPINFTNGNPLIATMGEFMDGFFFAIVPNSNAVQYSNLLDGTTWDVLSSFQKEGGADRLMAIAAIDEILWLFGDRTSEVWENTGGATNPFQRVQNIGFINAGIVAPFSIAKLHDGLLFLGKDDRGSAIVYQTKGYNIVRVSNHAVESAFSQMAVISDAVGYTYQDQGHTFYVLRFPTANQTWVYDVTDSATAQTPLWHERGFWNIGTGQYSADRAGFHCLTFDQHLVQDQTNGVIYSQSTALLDDFGNAIRRLRTSPHLVDELKWIFYKKLQIDMSVGIPNTSTNPVCILGISNDGGYTFLNQRTQSTGQVGQFGIRVNFRVLGRSRDRVFQLIITEPIIPTVVGAYMDIEEGTS